jgi:copper resistance protein C
LRPLRGRVEKKKSLCLCGESLFSFGCGFTALSSSLVKKISGIILTGLFLFAPTAASAHAYLVKSVPAGRATLFNSPGKIQLWFNERLEAKYSYASVHDAEGKRVDSDNAQVLAEDPKQLSIGVKNLPAGRYTVKFRVLSVDGHVVEQSFPFTIREAKN